MKTWQKPRIKNSLSIKDTKGLINANIKDNGRVNNANNMTS